MPQDFGLVLHWFLQSATDFFSWVMSSHFYVVLPFVAWPLFKRIVQIVKNSISSN